MDSNNAVFKINQTLNCGPALVASTAPFECDNPEDMQFGSDGNFYLLTYGDGFFAANSDAGMYKWSYTKGPEAPTARIAATADQRHRAADRPVHRRPVERSRRG